MNIRDDFTQPVIVQAQSLEWVASPVAGVDRRMLFRIGGEVARATSIVRYAPGSAFPRHIHGGGEEILVLDGTFQDEHGNYPSGCYFRNPPGTSHIPASAEGCTIFVRLWQFREADKQQIVRQLGDGDNADPRAGATRAMILFDDDYEKISMEDWAPNSAIELANGRGLEFLVLAGDMAIGNKTLGPQSWGRLPAGTRLRADVGPQGARVWIRDAPLLHPGVCKMA